MMRLMTPVKAAPWDDGPRRTALLGTERATPAFELGQLNISQIDLQVALDLGYGKLFNSNVNAELYFYLVELLATVVDIATPTPGQRIEVAGVGFRMGMAVQKASATGDGSLGAVAAQASLQRITQSLDFDVYGCPAALQQAFYDDFGANTSRFDLDRLSDLGKALGNLTAGMVAEAQKPQPAFNPYVFHVAETGPVTFGTREQACSIGYALHRITENDSYADATLHLLGSLASNDTAYPYRQVDVVTVRGLYAQVVGSNPTQKPNKANKDQAEYMQRLGR